MTIKEKAFAAVSKRWMDKGGWIHDHVKEAFEKGFEAAVQLVKEKQPDNTVFEEDESGS
jgi:hypothetical protein